MLSSVVHRRAETSSVRHHARALSSLFAIHDTFFTTATKEAHHALLDTPCTLGAGQRLLGGVADELILILAPS